MRFQGLDLNLLLALDRLIKDQSVSVASRNLHLSPSALSHALSRLREYFGDELLVPAGRKLVLTPLAQTLQAPMREALLHIEAVLSHTPRFDVQSSRRHFTLMASDYSITVCVAETLRRLRDSSTQITTQIVYPDDPIGRLEAGDVDLIILPQQHLAPEHPRAALYEDNYVMVVWSEGALASETIDAERYFMLGHVEARFSLGRNAALIEGSTLGAPRQRRVQITAPSFTLVPLLVCGTDLIATLPQRLAQVMSRTLPLTLKPLPFELPLIHEQVQWNMYRQSDPAIAWLVTQLQASCR